MLLVLRWCILGDLDLSLAVVKLAEGGSPSSRWSWCLVPEKTYSWKSLPSPNYNTNYLSLTGYKLVVGVLGVIYKRPSRREIHLSLASLLWVFCRRWQWPTKCCHISKISYSKILKSKLSVTNQDAKFPPFSTPSIKTHRFGHFKAQFKCALDFLRFLFLFLYRVKRIVLNKTHAQVKEIFHNQMGSSSYSLCHYDLRNFKLFQTQMTQSQLDPSFHFWKPTNFNSISEISDRWKTSALFHDFKYRSKPVFKFLPIFIPANIVSVG